MKKLLGFILAIAMLLNITPAVIFAEEIPLDEIFIEESFGCDLAVSSSGSYTVELDLKNYVDYNIDTVKPYFCFYASDEAVYPTKYILEQNFKLFVNGIEIDTVDSAAVKKYIVNNLVGKFELTDTYGSNAGYDIVEVEYYATVMVTSVSSNKIYFNNVADLNLSALSIDKQTLETEDIELNVYMNGEKIEASEIKKNDILSIKYDPTVGKNSKFFDVYVSRDVREGVFASLDVDNLTVTIDTEDYIFVNWVSATTEFKKENLSNEYKIYLDSFGRIYTWEKTALQYAIVDKYQQATSSSTYDSDRVRLWFTDGTYSFVEFATTAKIVTPDGYSNNLAGVRDYFYENYAMDGIMNRVVSYKISPSTGKITSLELLTGTKVEGKYDARNEKIGSTIVNDDTTFINASEYLSTGKIDDIKTSSKDAFVNDFRYIIYRYGTPSIEDNSFPLVLIFAGEVGYTEKTEFAVVTKPLGTSINEDGIVIDTLTVLYEGEEQILYLAEETWYDYDLVAGDVVVFAKNLSGEVEEIVRIFEGNSAGFDDYNTLKINGLMAANFNAYTVNPTGGAPFTTVWNPADSDLAKIVYAPIVTFKGRNYLAQVDSYYKTYFDKEATKDTETSEGATLELITTDDANVYVYDYSRRSGNRFSIGSAGDIIGTTVDHITTFEGDYYTIDWSELENDDQVNFAFAKIVDDIVTDIFVITEGEEIINTDNGIAGNTTNVVSVSGGSITVNVMKTLATVYAVDYDGETIQKVQSFDAKTGKQTFTADFAPDAVYIWDSNMEALSMPWRNE